MRQYLLFSWEYIFALTMTEFVIDYQEVIFSWEEVMGQEKSAKLQFLRSLLIHVFSHAQAGYVYGASFLRKT